MNRRDTLLIVSIGVGSVALALAATVPIDTTPIDRSIPSQPAAAVRQNETTVGDGQLLELSDRPLMSPNRRPHETTIEPVLPEEPQAVQELDTVPGDPASLPPALRLLGIELSSSGKSALVATPESDEPTWVKIGEGVGGWQVVDINAQSIMLEPTEGSSPPLVVPLYSEEAPCETC